MNRPTVVFLPQALLGLQRGFDRLADLLLLTLGPTQGVVLSSTNLASKPELLADSATIARRITAVPDPLENTGLMLLRGLVWRMHERAGDGGATAAVLARAILTHTLRSVAAGANAMQVSRGILQAAHLVSHRLGELSRTVGSEDDLVAVARAVTGHTQLSLVLGELFHLLGPQASITIEDYQAPYLEREYLEGGRWASSLASPVLVTVPALQRAIQPECQVALYDGVLSTAAELVPLLELAGSRGSGHLLLVAHKITAEATTLLASTHSTTGLKIVAVSLTRAGEKASTDLADLATLCGGQVISPVMGRRLQHVRPADLGQARRVEADQQDLFVTGGAGDPAGTRRQIEILDRRLKDLPLADDGRGELEMRLGRLAGSAGVLKIGAYTQAERSDLHQRAGQALKVLRGTLEDGFLPGGGSAYLHAAASLDPLCQTVDSDAAHGVRAVQAALVAPFQAILHNAGAPAPAVQAQEIRSQPPGLLYDVSGGRLVTAWSSGILDSTRVLRLALETAASGATMALRTGAVILKRNPQVSYEP